MNGHGRFGAFAILVVIAALLPAAPAMAAGFSVNTDVDAPDLGPGDGVCDSSDGPGVACSLRAAIQEANAHDTDDEIDLPSGDYQLAGNLGALVIDAGQGLAINGASARDTIVRQETDVNGDGLARVFDITAADATVAIRHVTIADGRATDFAGSWGGNIRSVGDLTLEQTTITGGRAFSGGGISNVGGSLHVVDSTISDNSAPDGGADSGAIHNFDPD